jgi:hypothetical protein
MDDEDIRKFYIDLMREIMDLRARHEALLQVTMEALPTEIGLRKLEKYDRLRTEHLDAYLLAIEKNQPRLAADLLRWNPIFPNSGEPPAGQPPAPVE